MKENRVERVKWARSLLKDFNVNRKCIVLSDKDKFDMSDRDDLNYYWYDLRQNAGEIEWDFGCR